VWSKISETSWINTSISLAAAIDGAGTYVEFESEVEWQETMKFLKVEFPVDVVNTEASYETQYGLTKRPTHYNTTWDMAKFEVCCQKWADLSEHGFGVSILNDCKYGFATTGNVMRLSLLRAPKAPDAHADLGRHSFCYAVYPHAGGVGESTVRTAADFNNPMSFRHVANNNLQKTQAILNTVRIADEDKDTSSIILDTVKRGEDDDDVSVGGLPTRSGQSVILRLYESMGGRATTRIQTSLPVKKVFKVNILEDDLEEVEFEDVEVSGMACKQVAIVLRAFEVGTFRLQL